MKWSTCLILENDFKRLKQENAEKAKEAAVRLFPNENWKEVEEGIYLSPNRAIGKKSSYKEELRDAQILRNAGSTVYLTPEYKSANTRQYDAIVDGLQFEFKNVSGNANTLQEQFLVSRSQAQNVFINLETSSLTMRYAAVALARARNSVTHTNKEGRVIKGYDERNRVGDRGTIIIKLKNNEKLTYLNVDDLLTR